MTDIYYVDGDFVPADQAMLPIGDLAVLRGYGVFDFLRTYGGKPFFLKAHIKRLIHSAEGILMSPPWSMEQIYEIVMDTLGRNEHPESNIRILITGGETEDNIMPVGKPRLMVMVTPVQRFPDSWYNQGVKIITFPVERLFPEAKSINYIPAIVGLHQARKENAVEAVYKDRYENIKEGTTSNIFLFIDDRLVTPEKQQVLPGITRQVILNIAEGHFEVDFRNVSYEEAKNAQEVFLSASNKEILPVVNIDGFSIGDGRPGKRVMNVMHQFRRYTKQWAAGEITE
jgi:branched-chain amino acid aminotransferase